MPKGSKSTAGPSYPRQTYYPQAAPAPQPPMMYGYPQGPPPGVPPPPYAPPGQLPPAAYYSPPPPYGGPTPYGGPMNYAPAQPNTVMVHGAYDAGARFDGISRAVIPPPPPGALPNAAQLAAAHGTHVVATQQSGNYMTGGSDGGYTIW